jgi:hypothetical protein
MTNHQSGAVNPFLVTTIIFGVLVLGLGAGFGWAFMQYRDYKQNSDDKVAAAVDVAKDEQKDADDKVFAEKYKEPFSTYRTPGELGNVSLEYPKTWAVFNQSDGKGGGQLTAYFYPQVVPPINNQTAYALRVTIEDKAYDQVLKSYDSKVKKGELSTSPLVIGQTDSFKGYEGVRINGQFDKTINGSAAIFKIRDKTLTLRVDSQDFMGDFDNIVLTKLVFEP